MKTPTRTLLASALLCAPLMAGAASAQLTARAGLRPVRAHPAGRRRGCYTARSTMR
ncbi:MAG: hypothetical protein PBU97_03425 [Stenotrophomonas maltophilia]